MSPDLIIAIGVGLVVAAIFALAGAWWAVGFTGAVLIWAGVVREVDSRRQRAAQTKDGT